MSLENTFSDGDSTRVEESSALVIRSSPAQKVLEDFTYYPKDFTYPMAICYEYLTLRDNWTGVLPCQWTALYAKLIIPGHYYSKGLYNYIGGRKPALAVLHSEEVNQLTAKEQAKGAEMFRKLIELGPKVREAVFESKWAAENSKDTREERRGKFIKGMVEIETTTCETLGAFANWAKRIVFISLGQMLCIKEAGNGMLFISQPTRSAKDGLETIEQPWIKKTMQETQERIREQLKNRTCYLASVYCNVVCLFMASSASLPLRAISTVNFLDPDNDVVNAIKLGLFLSGACREECLSVIEQNTGHVNKVEAYLENLDFKPCEVKSRFPTQNEEIQTSFGKLLSENNTQGDSNSTALIRYRDEELVSSNSSSVVTLDQLEITLTVTNISEEDDEYDNSTSDESECRASSILSSSFFSDEKVVEAAESRLARAEMRISRRQQARMKQTEVRTTKRRKISHTDHLTTKKEPI